MLPGCLKEYAVLFVVLCVAMPALAGEGDNADKTSRFSHKGLKGALGLGEFGASRETQLRDGQAVSLNLGYGFSDKTTLWLSVNGAEHRSELNPELITEFGALEINLQYKFRAEARLQPYGKVGLGGYTMRQQMPDITQIGGGFALALGSDYFFSRHFGIGAELIFKDIKYSREAVKTSGGDVTRDLRPRLNRDSFGFLFTITVQ
jgi:hypothetical protein